jgi:hypothetical protein
MITQFDVEEQRTITHLCGFIPEMPDNNPFFPEQKVLKEGIQQLRGGAQFYCSQFGANSRASILVDSKEKITRLFEFGTPWKHAIEVSGSIREQNQFVHELHVKHGGDEKTKRVLPLSATFQAYIATHDRMFRIYYGDSFSITSSQIIPGENLFVPGTGNADDVLQVIFSDYRVEFYIEGLYQDFFVWTDYLAGYICVKSLIGMNFTGPCPLDTERDYMGRCTLIVT